MSSEIGRTSIIDTCQLAAQSNAADGCAEAKEANKLGGRSILYCSTLVLAAVIPSANSSKDICSTSPPDRRYNSLHPGAQSLLFARRGVVLTDYLETNPPLPTPTHNLLLASLPCGVLALLALHLRLFSKKPDRRARRLTETLPISTGDIGIGIRDPAPPDFAAAPFGIPLGRIDTLDFGRTDTLASVVSINGSEEGVEGIVGAGAAVSVTTVEEYLSLLTLTGISIIMRTSQATAQDLAQGGVEAILSAICSLAAFSLNLWDLRILLLEKARVRAARRSRLPSGSDWTLHGRIAKNVMPTCDVIRKDDRALAIAFVALMGLINGSAALFSYFEGWTFREAEQW
ncbi:hypothetical protein BDK51DRAFT_51096 [Blyttiomyces helicus]|uniref:Uncharacterized protein n=1 Tax=Blyttiomyces helicus TaxID=388810 RepID=A0A4P9W1I5_9FUNG|nr:hypothetical protein BDK51DRAFT_51096 [Blyttiomyces helicus]|eukprot:RKO83936.1 hypothetical protein BDK51DRAFT_51096 [Blyttiomyces helicus]